MDDAEDMGHPIRVVSPTTDEEWRQAGILIDELQEWDVQQSQSLGFVREEVLRVFYPDDLDQIRRNSSRPGGCLLLAMLGSLPIGCAGFRRLTGHDCELYDVYVRAAYRGRSAGAILLLGLIEEAKAAGYRGMCLETATFMYDAHRLYRSLHFRVRQPYRSLPARYAKAVICMEIRFT